MESPSSLGVPDWDPFGATGRGFPLYRGFRRCRTSTIGQAQRDFWALQALAVPAAQGARLIVALADLVLLRAAAVFAFVLVALVRCRLQRSRFTLSFVGQQCFKLSFRCFVSIASFLGGPCE